MEEKYKVQVTDLHKSYDGVHEVIKGANLNVLPSEVVCIIGPSGSGKSTFLRCINKLEEFQKGHILVDGADLADPKADINKIRENIGMVFQHFNLFPNMTVLENITLAPVELGKEDKETAIKEAHKYLQMVNMDDKADVKPTTLSGGQQQRVAIARALAMKPDVMLFDEPTSALDPISTSKIEELALELKRNYTIVIVTHNMQQAVRISDKTGFFLLGDLVEFGETDQLFSMPKDERTEKYITGRFG